MFFKKCKCNFLKQNYNIIQILTNDMGIDI